jgi:acyl-coenzyme A thioesterase PaaI-like protein
VRITSAQAPEQHIEEHPNDHFLVLLDVVFGYEAGVVVGESGVRPTLFAADTEVVRPSLLFAMLDLMSGDVTGRPAGPTLDMRMQVLRPTPTEGRLGLVVRPLRIGKRIVVSEGTVSDASGQEIARAITTFMNMDSRTSRWPVRAAMVEPTFDEMIETRVRDERTLELVPGRRLINGSAIGTVQGGVQSLLAELCAQHAFGDGAPLVAIDIDVRFLSALREWPMVARAERLPDDRGAVRCRVGITDATGEKLATHVALTMVPADGTPTRQRQQHPTKGMLP